MILGNRELAEVQEREKKEADLKIGQYKRQHRFEKMQEFIQKCQVSGNFQELDLRKQRVLSKALNDQISRNEQHPRSMFMSYKMSTGGDNQGSRTHRGHTPSQAMRIAESQYNQSTTLEKESKTHLSHSRNSGVMSQRNLLSTRRNSNVSDKFKAKVFTTIAGLDKVTFNNIPALKKSDFRARIQRNLMANPFEREESVKNNQGEQILKKLFNLKQDIYEMKGARQL